MARLIITAAMLAVLALAGCGASGSPPASTASGTGTASAARPFRITPLFCGRYRPAQVRKFSDYGGLIFRYANTGTRPDSVVVRVNFTRGSQVLGSNVTAYEPVIRPGQSAYGEVGYPGGHVPAHISCQVTSISGQRQ